MTLLLTLDDGSIHQKLVDAVEPARAAAAEEAEVERVGAYVGLEREDAVSVTHLFEAGVPGYRGWRWSVTVATAGEDEPVTVSEVVLIPGPDARVAPAWVPWERRVQAGDLGVGDIFPASKDDPRLAPAYLASDDPAVEEIARDAGLGRERVLSRFGREDAATRWHGGEYGPRSDMARSAQFNCGTCGFYAPLAGSLRGAFGVCTNDISPADGHAVNVEYGCGAHSQIEVEVTSSIPVAELVYDDSQIDVVDVTPAPATGEIDVETSEVDVRTAELASGAGEAPAEAATETSMEAVSAPAEPVAETAVADPVEVQPAAVEQTVTDTVATDAAVPDSPAESEPTDSPTDAEPTEPESASEPTDA